MMISKTGYVAINEIAKHADMVAPDIGLTSADIKQWRNNVIAIKCLCDPVKRLFSDFLHVKANHKLKSYKPNRQMVSNTLAGVVPIVANFFSRKRSAT